MEQGGQLMTTTEVTTGRRSARTHRAGLMERIAEATPERFDTEIVMDPRQHRDFSSRPLAAEGDRGQYTCDALIIATGASARYLASESNGVPRPGRVGLRHLRRLLFRGQRRAVIGGGNTAVRRGALPPPTSRRTSRWCTDATGCAPRRSSRTAVRAASASETW